MPRFGRNGHGRRALNFHHKGSSSPTASTVCLSLRLEERWTWDDSFLPELQGSCFLGLQVSLARVGRNLHFPKFWPWVCLPGNPKITGSFCYVLPQQPSNRVPSSKTHPNGLWKVASKSLVWNEYSFMSPTKSLFNVHFNFQERPLVEMSTE